MVHCASSMSARTACVSAACAFMMMVWFPAVVEASASENSEGAEGRSWQVADTGNDSPDEETVAKKVIEPDAEHVICRRKGEGGGRTSKGARQHAHNIYENDKWCAIEREPTYRICGLVMNLGRPRIDKINSKKNSRKFRKLAQNNIRQQSPSMRMRAWRQHSQLFWSDVSSSPLLTSPSP